jgi:hypothetical protein
MSGATFLIKFLENPKIVKNNKNPAPHTASSPFLFTDPPSQQLPLPSAAFILSGSPPLGETK